MDAQIHLSGGYSPALSEVVPVAEHARLWITDIEILRLHYPRRCAIGGRRFEQNRDRIRALYDERFCRMWEMYLVGSEMAFRRDGHFVFQMQLAKSIDAVPLTRDYIFEGSARMLPAPKTARARPLIRSRARPSPGSTGWGSFSSGIGRRGSGIVGRWESTTSRDYAAAPG